MCGCEGERGRDIWTTAGTKRTKVCKHNVRNNGRLNSTDKAFPGLFSLVRTTFFPLRIAFLSSLCHTCPVFRVQIIGAGTTYKHY